MIKEEIIGLNLDDFNSNEDILNYMSDYLEEEGIVKDTFKESIINREKNFPTGLKIDRFGVAIPHTDAEHVNDDRIAIVTLNRPIIYEQMGGGEDVEVKLICMLLLTNSENHLIMLQKLMNFFQKHEIVEQIVNLENKPENHNLIRKFLKEHQIIV